MRDRPAGRRASLWRSVAWALGPCLSLCACGTTAEPSRRAPGGTIEETACGSARLVEGDRIRLTDRLGDAALRVRAIRLAPRQARWLLEDGWRDEAPISGATIVRAARAALRIPQPPCGSEEIPPRPFSLKLAAYGGEEIDPLLPVSARLVSAGRPIAGVRLRGPDGAVTVPAGAELGQDAGLLEVHADPPGSVALQEIALSVGRVPVELRSEYRDAIVASSVREAVFRIRVPKEGLLSLALAATDRPFSPTAAPEAAEIREQGGSYAFRISVTEGSSRREVLSERVPSSEASADRWHDRSVDLAPWAGRIVDLAMSVEALGTPPALALWGSPIVAGGDRSRGRRRAPNVLLISIDTLRADRIGRHAPSRSLTPHLDRLARDGALFTQCRTQAPSTLYGHVSLLSGLPPSAHGATTTSALAESIPYLPALLSGAGYTATAVTDAGLLDGRFGLTRGFDRFRNRFEPVEDKVRAAQDLLAALPEPWFLFLHTYEVHAPYDPPPQFARLLAAGSWAGLAGAGRPANDIALLTLLNNDRIGASAADVQHLERLYDAEVMRTDEALGSLFASLRERGLWDDTVVVVTSDHGEEFDEHGVIAWHSLTCYEEVQRVPLILKPGRRGAAGGRLGGRRIDAAVSSIDIAPSILDLAGLPVPDAMWGRSTISLLNGGAWPSRETLCEIENGRGAAILLDGWKYHMRTEASSADRKTFRRRLRTWGRYGTEELYRLEADAAERVNLAVERPHRARQLRDRLLARVAAARAHLSTLTKAAPPPARPRTDDEHVRRLRALGYVQ